MTQHLRRALSVVTLASVLALLALFGEGLLARSQAADSYVLSTSVIGSGVVSRSPSAAVYGAGSTVTLTAMPNAGWNFDRWEFDIAATANPVDVTMSRDLVVRAIFIEEGTQQSPTRYVLLVDLVGDCCGTVTPGDGASGGVYSYVPGEDVVLTASAEGTDGLIFSHWEGDAFGTVPVTSVRMDANKTVRAVFVLAAPQQYALTTDVRGYGSVTVSPIRPTYVAGESVTLIATAAGGWLFDRWEGEVSDFSAVTTLTVDREAIVRAVFVRAAYLSSLTIEVDGLGFVQSGGEILAVAPGTSTRAHQLGSGVTLTAVSFSGWRFDRWTGDASGSAATTTVAMGGDRTVRAMFVPATTNFVAVSMEISGAGSVSRSPGDFGYQPGQRVTLSATPADGWRFDRWELDASGTEATTKVTVSTDLTVRAVFAIAPIRYALTTSVSGAGSITVSPNASVYEAGARVTLQAVAAPGYRFQGWLGDAAGVSPSVTVVMSADLEIEAVFEFVAAQRVQLVTEISGEGFVSPFAGTSSHTTGSEVTLLAFPQPGWRFARWDGDIAGTVNPIEFDIRAPMTVRAVFVPEDSHLLSVQVEGEGVVSSDPAGAVQVPGSTVTLIAIAEAGWRFDHWEGAASGFDPAAAVVMLGDRAVRAVFVSVPSTAPQPSVAPSAGGYGYLPDSGSGLAVFDGGSVEQAAAGMASIWATAQGRFVGFVSGAPSFVNQRFMALFPDGLIPAGTPLFVVTR